MQKKAVKMDTVVLEKPIRWTEMAFGRVDYIIVDIFFSLTSKIRASAKR